MTADEIAAFIFFALIAIRLYKKRKKIRFYSLFFLEPWKGGMDWLDRFIAKHKRLISKVEALSLYTGFALMSVGIGFILYSLVQMKQTLAIVLPSVGGIKYPGPVVSVPFWYWLIAIFVIAFPHETFHAIFSKNENVKIKKYGIIYFILLPLGAFVEPEKKALEKLNWKKKGKIFSAGSFVNLLTAGIAFMLLILTNKAAMFLMKPIGINYTTIPGTPAYKANLSGTMIRINNHRIRTIHDLVHVLNSSKPGENITIYTTKGFFNVTLAERKGKAFLGISNLTEIFSFAPTGSILPNWIVKSIFYWSNLLFWIFILSLGVAIANMLPAKPLDGGLTIEAFLKEKFGKKKGMKIANVISIFVWILLIISLVSGNIQKLIGGLQFS